MAWVVEEQFAREHARKLRDAATELRLLEEERGYVEGVSSYYLEALAKEFEHAISNPKNRS